MFDAQTLGTIAQLGLGLAGFSGIALVLTRSGTELTKLEADRLGIMLGASLGATFLSVLPLVLPDFKAQSECRLASAVMATYTAAFLWFYLRATLRMRSEAPELGPLLPIGLVAAGHGINGIVQIASSLGLVNCVTAYLTGLFWLLFHGAYQFGRILFVRPLR